MKHDPILEAYSDRTAPLNHGFLLLEGLVHRVAASEIDNNKRHNSQEHSNLRERHSTLRLLGGQRQFACLLFGTGYFFVVLCHKRNISAIPERQGVNLKKA